MVLVLLLSLFVGKFIKDCIPVVSNLVDNTGSHPSLLYDLHLLFEKIFTNSAFILCNKFLQLWKYCVGLWPDCKYDKRLYKCLSVFTIVGSGYCLVISKNNRACYTLELHNLVPSSTILKTCVQKSTWSQDNVFFICKVIVENIISENYSVNKCLWAYNPNKVV